MRIHSSLTLAVYLISLIFPAIATAQLYLVDSTTDQIDDDVNDGLCATIDNTCTLRAAIQQANSFPGKDRINIPAGIYLLNVEKVSPANEDKGAKGDLDILEDVEIIGLGASPSVVPAPAESEITIIDGANIDRVFDVHSPASVKISNLIIQNGNTSGEGAGINIYSSYSNVTLVELSDVVLRNNQAKTYGGAINTGSGLALTRAQIFQNSATYGGGIYASGPIRISESRIDANTASKVAGGIYGQDDFIATETLIANNHVGLTADDITAYGGGLFVPLSNLVYLYNVTVKGNTSSGYGGGIYVGSLPIIVKTTITDNTAGVGGGGLYIHGGDTSIADSTLGNNSAGEKGGAVYLYSGTMDISNSVIHHNVTQNDSSVTTLGGGVYILHSTMTASNTTFSQNKAIGATSAGGGLYLDWLLNGLTELHSRAVLQQVTMALNEAANGGNAASHANNKGTLSSTNTVWAHAANNTNCNPDVFGTVAVLVSQSVNISSDDSCAPQSSTWMVADPKLDATLQINGEGTMTHALLDNSPAINASATAFCLPNDQRYYIRDTIDGFCDIGSLESGSTRAASGTAQFSIDVAAGQQYVVNESEGKLTATVIRTETEGNVSVDYRTLPGSAVENSDFFETSGTLTFNTGENSKTFDITIRPDASREPDEAFYLELFNPRGGVALTSYPIAQVLLQDDGTGSASPYFEFATSRGKVSENKHAITIMVNRSSDLSNEASINYELVTSYPTYANPATYNEDFLLTNGTLTFGPGETKKALIVDLLDDTLYEGDEVLDIRLAIPPGNNNSKIGINKEFELTIEDDEPQPWTVGFLISSQDINENISGGTASINVYFLSGEGTEPVSVDYAVVGGTANPGEDFTLAAGSITFDPTKNYGSIPIPINIHDDTVYEGNETILLELSNLSGLAQWGYQTQTTIQIIDDEKAAPMPGQLSFANTVSSYEEQNKDINIEVTRSNGSDGPVSIEYIVAGGNATNGSDYTLENGTLVFADKEISKSITVTLLDDGLSEPAENILLELRNPSGGATLGTSTTQITILASDQPPPPPPPPPQAGTFSFAKGTISVSEDQFKIAIQVVRQNGSDGTASVDYMITGGTATKNLDYASSAASDTGTLTFVAGETRKNIDLTIWDDLDIEGDETISLSLSNAQKADLGEPASTTITIKDNDAKVSSEIVPQSGGGGGMIDIGWLILTFLFWCYKVIIITTNRTRL